MTTEQPALRSNRRGWFGWPGLIASLGALALAAGGPWLADRLDPTPAPIDEVLADAAGRVKDRVVARLRGRIYKAPHREEVGPSWADRLQGLAIGFGLVGCSLGVLGVVRREDPRLVGSAVSVGVSAMAFHYFLMYAAALLLVMVIVLLRSALDGV